MVHLETTTKISPNLLVHSVWTSELIVHTPAKLGAIGPTSTGTNTFGGGGGLFGQNNQQQQQQQPAAGTSLFGQPQQNTSAFGNTFGRSYFDGLRIQH